MLITSESSNVDLSGRALSRGEVSIWGFTIISPTIVA